MKRRLPSTAVEPESKKPKPNVDRWKVLLLVLRFVHRMKALVAAVFRVDCVIYMYECVDTDSEHFGKNYVGQTRDSVKVRHNGHLYGRTKFDKAFKANPEGFSRSILEERCFKTMAPTISDRAKLLTLAQDWMNGRESHWIAKHGSFSNTKGFNRTKGGHSGMNCAYFDAQLLDMEQAWTIRWKAIHEFFRNNGHLRVPQNYRIPFAHNDRTIAGYKLGQTISLLRGGTIIITDQRRRRLNSLGMVWDSNAFEWELRWKAIQYYFSHHHNVLVPQKYRLPNRGVEKALRGFRLGRMIAHLRQGAIRCSENDKHRLLQMGMVWNFKEYQASLRWKAFEAYRTEHGNVDVPQIFQFPTNYRIPCLRDYALGRRVARIRRGEIHSSESDKIRLAALGFKWRIKASKNSR